MTKNDLLLYLCRETADISFCYDPKIYSVPNLSRRLNKTKYSIRKLMEELEADGFVRKTHIGGTDEDGYPYCYHGWSITEQTFDSDMYKQCYKEALREYERFCREFDERWERKGEDNRGQN